MALLKSLLKSGLECIMPLLFVMAIDELTGDLLFRESRTEKFYYQNTFPEVFS